MTVVLSVLPCSAVLSSTPSAVFAKTPLTRSEWLKYFAAFFNKEFESEPLYRQIRNNYNSLMRAATSASVPRKTVVAWTFKGWSSDFVISKASYKVAYVQVPRATAMQ